MYHDTGRGINCQCCSIYDAVIRLDEFHTEITQIDGLTELHHFAFGLLHEIMLCQLVLNDPHGQTGCVDGHIDITQHIGQCSDMILMSMSDDKSLYLIDIILQICYIGNDQIDSQHIIRRERQSAVHHNNTVLILEGSNVHTNLLQTAQRNDLQA